MCCCCSAVGICVRSTTAKARPYIGQPDPCVDVAKGMEPDTLYHDQGHRRETEQRGGPQNAKPGGPFRPDPCGRGGAGRPPPSFQPARMKPLPSMAGCSATPVCVYTNASIRRGADWRAEECDCTGCWHLHRRLRRQRPHPALITRGIAEIARLGVAIGCNITPLQVWPVS